MILIRAGLGGQQHHAAGMAPFGGERSRNDFELLYRIGARRQRIGLIAGVGGGQSVHENFVRHRASSTEAEIVDVAVIAAGGDHSGHQF